jgi:hypothetical protein
MTERNKKRNIESKQAKRLREKNRKTERKKK